MHVSACRSCRNSKILPVVLAMAGSDAVAGGSGASAVPRDLPPGDHRYYYWYLILLHMITQHSNIATLLHYPPPLGGGGSPITHKIMCNHVENMCNHVSKKSKTQGKCTIRLLHMLLHISVSITHYYTCYYT